MSLALVEVPPATSAKLLFNLVCSIVMGKTGLRFRIREFLGYFYRNAARFSFEQHTWVTCKK